MNIVTLTEKGLDWQTRILAKEVEAAHPRGFDIVIAIKNGGCHVAESFMKSFPNNKVGFYAEVDLQRPSTKHKKGMFIRILPSFPLVVRNAMRYAEAILLGIERIIKSPKILVAPLSNELATRLKAGKKHVLILDDAIDSGSTALAVAESIMSANPKAAITVAVITVTTNKPLIKADHFIYGNGTLVRFPWSKDNRT